jgi:hypothetical protein
MRATTRFLTAGLAAVAIASTIGLATPASAADEARPCGQSAVPAVYVTVVREGVLVRVPAVTHDEWRWQRTVTTIEHEFSRVVEEAYTETDWIRTLPDTTELEWVRTVTDQVAVPEVPATDETGHWEDVVGAPTGSVVEYEYRQQTTGNLRWAPDGWNGEQGEVDHGRGWTKTGRTRQWHVDHASTTGSPAIPEKSHTVTEWAALSPGDEWSATGASRVVPGATQTATTRDGARPAGDGWVQDGAPRTVPAVVDTRWAEVAPDGWTATGAVRPHEYVEQTDAISPTAPEGDDWTAIEDSRVTVVDVPAHTETVGGSVQQVLVTPAQDATAPCSAVGTGQAPSTAPDGSSVGTPAPGWVLTDAVQTSHPATHAHHGQSANSGTAVDGPRQSTASSPALVLPATGSPVSPLLLATGLGALLTGGVLVRSGRRRA